VTTRAYECKGANRKDRSTNLLARKRLRNERWTVALALGGAAALALAWYLGPDVARYARIKTM
jgi:hypothetical protein